MFGQQCAFKGHAAQSILLAVRAGVTVGLFIKDEVRTTERAIGSFAFVPHRHMRLDALVVNHPTQELSRAAGRVTN